MKEVTWLSLDDTTVIHAKYCLCPTTDEITIAGVKIGKSVKARNIEVIFDSHMDLEQHINHICKVAFCHIRNLSRIRNCLSLKDTETLVHAFITTKLDNCNSLLAELPQTLIDKLQRVHNAAGRLVSLTCKYDKIITPVWISIGYLLNNVYLSRYYYLHIRPWMP